MAGLSGILLGLSFPKFGTGIVAFVALTPLLLALLGLPPARAAALAYGAGVVSSIILLYWTALVVMQYGGLSLALGSGAMLLLCLAFSLFTALFGWTVGFWARVLGPGALLLSPFAWVATEILRAHVLLRFSWCLLGYSQYRAPLIIQGASWAAVYGISFLVAGCSAVIAYALSEAPRRRKAWALAGFLVLMGGNLAYGAWALSQPAPSSGRLRVGLVQGNVAQEEKWDPEKAYSNLERHIALTTEAASAGARLVVWPESALPFSFDDTPTVADHLRALVREKGIYLLFGNDDREDGRTFVGAKMLAPEGELIYRYHKIRLVPFGEYVPSLFGRRFTGKVVEQVSDFTPGEKPSLGRVDGQALGAFICYEAIFPDLIREFAGADLLVNITNDAWYGRTSAPEQHFAMAVFRAVENRKYLIRAANTGVTAVVDPEGRVLARTELFVPTVLVREVAFVPGRTIYARFGDVFAWSCLGVSAIATLLVSLARSR
jgi:apolipoprotein N-acyltransferase